MKKIFQLTALLLVLSMLLVFAGCNAQKTAAFAKGEWKFSAIAEVQLKEGLDDYTLAYAMSDYGATDVESLLAAALEAFANDNTFAPLYVKFDGDSAYAYEPIMEREATWVFYQMSETTGFLAPVTDLDPSQGNPNKESYPSLSYDAATDTLSFTMGYAAFMFTLTLRR